MAGTHFGQLNQHFLVVQDADHHSLLHCVPITMEQATGLSL